MFSRVIPSWEHISQFRQPLTEGEECLLKFLDDNLPYIAGYIVRNQPVKAAITQIRERVTKKTNCQTLNSILL